MPGSCDMDPLGMPGSCDMDPVGVPGSCDMECLGHMTGWLGHVTCIKYQGA